MKNEQFIEALEIELTELTHKVDALQEKVNLEASQENHEINFLKNEIEQFAKKLAELKLSPIKEIDKKLLYEFGQQVVKFLEDVISSCELETYSPVYRDEVFEVDYNNRIIISSIEVDTNDLIQSIKNDFTFSNLCEYLPNNILNYVLENQTYFIKLTDDIFEKAISIIPKGYHTMCNNDELDLDLDLNDCDIYINGFSMNFENFVLSNMDITLTDFIDELIPNIYDENTEINN